MICLGPAYAVLRNGAILMAENTDIGLQMRLQWAFKTPYSKRQNEIRGLVARNK